ncbi:MAG: hypothetical protein C0467_30770 [Planctomycetaceae bacterium]|nr:hypothetical protein [Planctomycetaceae bacterium]
MYRLLTPVLLVALGGTTSAQPRPSSADFPSLGKKYSIDLVTRTPKFPVKTGHGPIDGAEADRKEAESYAAIFAFEWSLYPPELVRKTGIKAVVFCKDLTFDGQKRTAIPDFEHDTLYLDVSRGRHDDLYVRRVIHHEFFHFVDLKDDNHLYEDERWVKLNPPGFKYGPGGAKLQNDPTVTTTGKDDPGFMNRYAAAGVEEDKAELFAHMMVEPKVVAVRVEKDRYIRAKVERMRELMSAFTPRIDRDFWSAVEKVQRPEPK